MGTLTAGSLAVADRLAADAARLGVHVHAVAGARVLDCGVHAPGGLAAGVLLARLTTGDLLDVALVPDPDRLGGPAVQVHTDHPARACLAAQYAGWQVAVGKYFAMGSGPARAVYAKEPLFNELGLAEPADAAVLALEARKLPPPEVIEHVAEKLKLPADRLTVAVAPAASLAGGVQVVARSVETALHKLHALGFDPRQVVAGYGTAPLPPVAKNELAAVGRTNDSILYAGRVTLWVDADDAAVAAVGPRVPSTASPDHGARFADLFARYGDFYKIDPHLFSPAVVALNNRRTGQSLTFGEPALDVARASFAGAG